jgi:hypothetical protein
VLKLQYSELKLSAPLNYKPFINWRRLCDVIQILFSTRCRLSLVRWNSLVGRRSLELTIRRAWRIFCQSSLQRLADSLFSGIALPCGYSLYLPERGRTTNCWRRWHCRLGDRVSIDATGDCKAMWRRRVGSKFAAFSTQDEKGGRRACADNDAWRSFSNGFYDDEATHHASSVRFYSSW